MRYPPIRDQKLKRDISGLLVLAVTAAASSVALGLGLLEVTQPSVRQVTGSELMQQHETDRRLSELETNMKDLRTRLTLLENRNQ